MHFLQRTLLLSGAVNCTANHNSFWAGKFWIDNWWNICPSRPLPWPYSSSSTGWQSVLFSTSALNNHMKPTLSLTVLPYERGITWIIFTRFALASDLQNQFGHGTKHLHFIFISAFIAFPNCRWQFHQKVKLKTSIILSLVWLMKISWLNALKLQ